MPSGTGWQVSLLELLGVGVAWEEGIELNYVHGQAVGLPKQGWAKAAKEKLCQMTEGAHFPVKTSGTSAHAAPVLASGV